MSTSYESNRAWSDKFIPEIKRIVGPRLLDVSSFEVDTKQATDLILFTARDMRIAARMRRKGYADRFPYDFTIRSRHDSGAKTEFSKLVEGFGDWMFYGHEGDNYSISKWMLIDLHKWRAELIRLGYKGKIRKTLVEKDNGDGTHFYYFDIREMRDILIDTNIELPTSLI